MYVLLPCVCLKTELAEGLPVDVSVFMSLWHNGLLKLGKLLLEEKEQSTPHADGK